MRIAYRNLLDQLPSAQVVPSTETVLYEAVNVQDQRLEGTQWWTTSPTSQTIIFGASTDTIVGGNIGLVTGSSATNLVPRPEDLTDGAAWLSSNIVITTAGTVLGMQLNKIANTLTTQGIIKSLGDIGFGASSVSATLIARYGNFNESSVAMRDTTSSETRMGAAINWTTKAITYAEGTEAMPPEWIDDQTVRVFVNAVDVVAGNTNVWWLYGGGTGGGGTVGDYTFYTAVQAIDNTYPVPYVATSRTAIDTSYAFRLPPSGKFIVDCEFKPFTPYDTSADANVWSWFISSSVRLELRYQQSTDVFSLAWNDNGTTRVINNPTVFDDGTAQTLNQIIRIIASLDLSAAVTTGSRVILIPKDQGVLQESNAWNGPIGVLATSTFTTLREANRNSDQRMDGIFRHLRVHGGVFSTTESLATDAEIDTALTDHELLLDQAHQNQFNFDTVAIMGHNISEGAAITFQANDFNEWNYTDGSGSSIIQHTLAWDDETILKMITKTKKTYAKFTINDPNNDAAQLKIGRIWLGPYIDIDPSSLDDFKVVKKRSDRNQYSRNRNKWSDKGVGWRRFELTFPRSGTTMIEKIQTMYDFSGNHSSMIFMNFDTLREYRIVSPVYCSIDGDIGFGHRGRQKYVYGLNLEEDF